MLNEHTGWEILAKGSGGFNIEVSSFGKSNFFIRPSVDLYYLGILPNELKIAVKNGYAGFFILV